MNPIPVAIALTLGLLARQLGLPPLLGFLATGFILNAFSIDAGGDIRLISELGVTLLLFTIGLKLDIRRLLKPHIWGTASLHMLIIICCFGAALYGLAIAQIGPFRELTLQTALIIAFALSFSSTVFAVKVLEDKGKMHTLQAQVSIGILIMQDLFAVIFLVFAAGKIPTFVGIILIIAVVLCRKLLVKLMNTCGHGELLILFGMLLAIGGAQVFDNVGIKGDLGALLLGVLLAGNEKANEMAKTLLRFKDLFLVGFFIEIGLVATPDSGIVALACMFTLLMPLKSALFFGLLTRLRLTTRTSFKSSLLLSSYSEFGLIVAGVATFNGWLTGDWLIAIAIALSLTFVLASPANAKAAALLEHFHKTLTRFEKPDRLPEEAPIDVGNARAVILGMGRVGTGAYDSLRESYNENILGVDTDSTTVHAHQQAGRNVLSGDVTDPSFWKRIRHNGTVEVALLTMSKHEANMVALNQREHIAKLSGGKQMILGAAALYSDQAEELREAGADVVVNFYKDTGAVLADALMDEASKNK